MRVLFVVPNVPSPIRPRPLYFIRRLASTHELSVICLASNEADERFLSDLRQYCHSLEVIRLSPWRSFANCLLALFSANSLRCAYFYSSSLREQVRARVEADEVDLIHAEHLKSLPTIEDALRKVPIVFDAVDCLSMLEWRRRRVTRNPFVKLFSWIEQKKLARMECKAVRQCSRATISSSVDRKAYPIPDGVQEKIDVVPNGVDLENFGFQQFEPQKDVLVFCAKLDYFPNEDAALYLARHIWPVIKARRPELRLEIVGSRPSTILRRLDGKDNIRVIASVPDVRPYLARAWVALCPIRIRAGIQNKLLEAMALGVPLVAAPVCLEGLQVEPGKHLLVADGPDQFASAVELLLDNVTLRDKLTQAGRAYVERNHNWVKSIEALSNSYTAAIADFKADRNRATSMVSVPLPHS